MVDVSIWILKKIFLWNCSWFGRLFSFFCQQVVGLCCCLPGDLLFIVLNGQLESCHTCWLMQLQEAIGLKFKMLGGTRASGCLWLNISLAIWSVIDILWLSICQAVLCHFNSGIARTLEFGGRGCTSTFFGWKSSWGPQKQHCHVKLPYYLLTCLLPSSYTMDLHKSQDRFQSE